MGSVVQCFRPPAGLTEVHEATVGFVVQADGTATEIELEQASGNAEFDGAALEAIRSCVDGRFGPVPPGQPDDRMPMKATFRAPSE